MSLLVISDPEERKKQGEKLGREFEKTFRAINETWGYDKEGRGE